MTEREQFDAWRRTVPNGVIFEGAVNAAWLAWQAARAEPTFCRACGASIPHRVGEGRCPECMHHEPV